MPRTHNKEIKETKRYTHTTSQFSACVDRNSCLTSMTWLTLQSSRQVALALALPSFCPPNNLMQSSNSHMFTCCFTHNVQLPHKHSFIMFHLTHFNIIRCKRMFLNNTSMTIALSFGVTRKWSDWYSHCYHWYGYNMYSPHTLGFLHGTPLQQLK
jgi:hypothetical protein